jgi:hypothetical protein
MFQPIWSSSGALNLIGGTAAPLYAVTIHVHAFFTFIIQV